MKGGIMSKSYELYKIREDIKALLRIVDEHFDPETGEIDDIGQEAYDKLHDLYSKQFELFEEVLKERVNKKATIKTITETIAELTERKKQLEKALLTLDRLILDSLEQFGGKYKGKLFSAYVKRTPAVTEVNIEELPDEIDGKPLKRIKVEPNKEAILKLWKQGKPIIGAKVEEKESVVIRLK